MSKSPAFQMYPNDFLGSGKVAAMDLEQTGAYTLLLCYDWNEGGLPNDFKILARWIRVSERRFEKLWKHIKSNFELKGGRWYNPRLERERAKQAANREKKQDAAAARWSKRIAPAYADADAPAMQMECSPSSIASASAFPSALPTTDDYTRARAREALPEKYRPDLDSLLDTALSKATERESWVRSLHAVLFDGYEFPSRDPEHLGQGLREMLGTPGAPTWRKYAGFVRKLTEKPGPQNSGKRGPSRNGVEPAIELAAGQQLEEIQKLRVQTQTQLGIKYHIPKQSLEELPTAVRAAIAALGGSLTSGAQRIIDTPTDKYGILLAQFTKLYAGAIQTERTKMAASDYPSLTT